jgi:Alternative complex III, ActD subunit
MDVNPPLYGLMAEFDNPTDVVTATREAYDSGYRRINAYSPYPIEELAEALHFHTRLPLIVLIGGIIGCLGGYLMQYYMEVIDYPINVGGRPYHSWPSFIPITFECTVLAAAFAAVFGMLALNKLPQPYHPVFNVERFALATRDRFFLVIEARDPKFDHEETTRFLASLNPRGITDVEA